MHAFQVSALHPRYLPDPEEEAQATIVATTAAAVVAAAARATAADTSIITHGGAGWARRGAGHWAGGRVDDGREKERERERERWNGGWGARENGAERRGKLGDGRGGGGGTEEVMEEEEEEEERGVSGQPGSSRATRRKPRYHPPSTPHLFSTKRPCHTSLFAPSIPATSSCSSLAPTLPSSAPYPNLRRASTFTSF